MTKKIKLIKEFSEFSAMGLNGASTTAPASVDNKQTSLNAYDNHLSIISQSFNRIIGINNDIANSPLIRTLKKQINLDEQEIKSIKIIKIFNNDSIFDVYISFVIDDYEYWGIIKDILGSATVVSEVFKDLDLVVTKEWEVRIKGLLIKHVKTYIYDISGRYRLLNTTLNCRSTISGDIRVLNSGDIINVVKVSKSKITFKIDSDETYILTDNNLIFFKWYFEKIE